MQKSPLIRLQIPNTVKKGRYFICRLKTELKAESPSFPKSDKTIVIAGINGDFKTLQRFLVKNKVIDRKTHKWIFNRGHLVIMGNEDVWPNSTIICLWLLYSLEEQAKQNGGYIHYILGEQDLFNLHGEWRNAHPDYYVSRQRKQISTAVFDGNNTISKWLETKNVIEKIGNILIAPGKFIHFMKGFKLSSVVEQNKMLKNVLIHKKQLDRSLQGSRDDSLLIGKIEAIRQNNSIISTVNDLGNVTLITSDLNGIGFLYFIKGNVIRISEGLDNKLVGLLISKDKLFKLDKDGNKTRLQENLSELDY